MSDTANRALLPAGLADVLPPDAAYEAEVMEGLVATYDTDDTRANEKK